MDEATITSHAQASARAKQDRVPEESNAAKDDERARQEAFKVEMDAQRPTAGSLASTVHAYCFFQVKLLVQVKSQLQVYSQLQVN